MDTKFFCTLKNFKFHKHENLLESFHPQREGVVMNLCSVLHRLDFIGEELAENTSHCPFKIDGNLADLMSKRKHLLIGHYPYRQLILHPTTDNRTCIDHIYTNAPKMGKHVFSTT